MHASQSTPETPAALSPLQSSFAGRQLAPFRAQRVEARRQAAPVCAGAAGRLGVWQNGSSGLAVDRRGAAASRRLGLCRKPASLSSVPAAAAAEIKSLGADKWNDTYYPTAADAANVNKQWCVAQQRPECGGVAACQSPIARSA